MSARFFRHLMLLAEKKIEKSKKREKNIHGRGEVFEKKMVERNKKMCCEEAEMESDVKE